MNGMSILFTSVGRRVELLRAFRRAQQALGLQGGIVALDIDPLAPALQVADRPYIVPRLDHPDFLPQLLSICRSEPVGLVLPLIDPDVPVLAKNRQAIEATGARVASIAPAAVELAGDKWQTTQLFRRLGLPTPRSWLPEELDPDTAAYPLFIKPRWGSAGKGAFCVNDARELRFFTSYVRDPIIQELVTGPEITNDVLCDLQGEVLSVVSRRRIEVRWGEVAKGVTLWDAGIAEGCAQVARALDARGPITVQCLLRNGQPCFTEVNARLGGGAPLGIAAGADFPLWLLARAAGLSVTIPPLGSYRQGLYLTRFDDAYYLDQEAYDRLDGHRL